MGVFGGLTRSVGLSRSIGGSRSIFRGCTLGRSLSIFRRGRIFRSRSGGRGILIIRMNARFELPQRLFQSILNRALLDLLLDDFDEAFLEFGQGFEMRLVVFQ